MSHNELRNALLRFMESVLSLNTRLVNTEPSPTLFPRPARPVPCKNNWQGLEGHPVDVFSRRKYNDRLAIHLNIFSHPEYIQNSLGQLRPYDRIMYLLVPAVLRYLANRKVPWNGLMDLMAEGLEHGMRWIKHRFHHCNGCVSVIAQAHFALIPAQPFSTSY